jgi:septal ring factor EnvC (AmiA/AmiB activator)
MTEKADSALDILKEIRWKSQGRSYGMTEQETTSALDNVVLLALARNPDEKMNQKAVGELNELRAELAELKRRLKRALIELAKSDNMLGYAAALEEDIKELRDALAQCESEFSYSEKQLAALRADLASAREVIE